MSFFIVILLSGLATLLGGCARKEIINIDSFGENIICFGNSITAGSGAKEGEDFPSLLRQRLDIPVINAGKERDTTFDALKRIKRDVLDKKPLLVIVEFGGNDFLQKIPLKDTLKNIDEILRITQEQRAMVILLDVRINLFMNSYSRGFKGIAKKRGALFVPNILSEVLTKPNLKSDYIHPNNEGYKIISERILEVVSPLILARKSILIKNNQYKLKD